LVSLGLVGLAAIVAHTLFLWVPEAPSDRKPYVFQRIAFVLVTLSDVPLMQVTLAGVACWLGAWHKQPVATGQDSVRSCNR
jgi:hypothetical protein